MGNHHSVEEQQQRKDSPRNDIENGAAKEAAASKETNRSSSTEPPAPSSSNGFNRGQANDLTRPFRYTANTSQGLVCPTQHAASPKEPSNGSEAILTRMPQFSLAAPANREQNIHKAAKISQDVHPLVRSIPYPTSAARLTQQNTSPARPVKQQATPPQPVLQQATPARPTVGPVHGLNTIAEFRAERLDIPPQPPVASKRLFQQQTTRTTPVQQQATLAKPVQQTTLTKPVQQQTTLTKPVQQQVTLAKPVQQTTLTKPVQQQTTLTKPVQQQATLAKPVQQTTLTKPVQQQATLTIPEQQTTRTTPVQQQATLATPVQQATLTTPVQQTTRTTPVQQQAKLTTSVQQQTTRTTPVQQQATLAKPVQQTTLTKPVQQQTTLTKPVQQQATLAKPVQQTTLTKPVQQQATLAKPVQQTTLTKPVQQQTTLTKPVQQQATLAKPVQQTTLTKPVQQQATLTTPVQQTTRTTPVQQQATLATSIQQATLTTPVQQTTRTTSVQQQTTRTTPVQQQATLATSVQQATLTTSVQQQNPKHLRLNQEQATPPRPPAWPLYNLNPNAREFQAKGSDILPKFTPVPLQTPQTTVPIPSTKQNKEHGLTLQWTPTNPTPPQQILAATETTEVASQVQQVVRPQNSPKEAPAPARKPFRIKPTVDLPSTASWLTARTVAPRDTCTRAIPESTDNSEVADMLSKNTLAQAEFRFEFTEQQVMAMRRAFNRPTYSDVVKGVTTKVNPACKEAKAQMKAKIKKSSQQTTFDPPNANDASAAQTCQSLHKTPSIQKLSTPTKPTIAEVPATKPHTSTEPPAPSTQMPKEKQPGAKVKAQAKAPDQDRLNTQNSASKVPAVNSCQVFSSPNSESSRAKAIKMRLQQIYANKLKAQPGDGSKSYLQTTKEPDACVQESSQQQDHTATKVKKHNEPHQIPQANKADYDTNGNGNPSSCMPKVNLKPQAPVVEGIPRTTLTNAAELTTHHPPTSAADANVKLKAQCQPKDSKLPDTVKAKKKKRKSRALYQEQYKNAEKEVNKQEEIDGNAGQDKKEKPEEPPVVPPLAPEPPARLERRWHTFTVNHSCSHKSRCRHNDGAGLPPNVTKWFSVSRNYLCEPPWVTTATLAACLAQREARGMGFSPVTGDI